MTVGSHIIKFRSGEEVSVEYERGSFARCNICGLRFPSESGIPWKPDSKGGPVALFDVCPDCNTEWGFDDWPAPETPVGSVAALWMKLRLAYLDEDGWPDELVKRIEDNLHITRAELEAALDERDRLK